MIKHILIPLLLVSIATGQVGLINDKDGYTNVRESPNIDSKIVYKIQDYELFFYEFENTSENDSWIKVYVPKNKYALDCDGVDNLMGYIHKSRLQPLDKLEKYEGTDFSFHYNLASFSFDNKIIDYLDGKYISKINGRPFYGTDGVIPSNEIMSIEIRVEENTIYVPKVLYQDLFVLTNEFTIFRKNDWYYVHQWNSDGAGGYLLVWAIDKNSIRQRLIMIP